LNYYALRGKVTMDGNASIHGKVLMSELSLEDTYREVVEDFVKQYGLGGGYSRRKCNKLGRFARDYTDKYLSKLAPYDSDPDIHTQERID
jgi:hypothetical protein